MSITTPDAQPSPEASASVSLRRDESARQADARDRADMEQLIAGHDAALNDLMERHATPVFHFLCRMVGNEDDANDLAQETFARVFRARASFRTSEKFSAWLFTIAANLARNHFRWRARHPNVSLEAETGETNPWQHASGE
jgi:RNA polymerase sigma-70 factor (ECF subfamily)